MSRRSPRLRTSSRSIAASSTRSSIASVRASASTCWTPCSQPWNGRRLPRSTASRSTRPVAPNCSDYYREKWVDVGPLYLAELLSTEFMTEQRARGDILFSERLLQLGRTEPELWHEIRQFFRRKEMVTALLAAAHDPAVNVIAASASEDDEEDLWE